MGFESWTEYTDTGSPRLRVHVRKIVYCDDRSFLDSLLEGNAHWDVTIDPCGPPSPLSGEHFKVAKGEERLEGRHDFTHRRKEDKKHCEQDMDYQS